MTELDARARAEGRSVAYGMLARLMLRGLDAEMLARLQAADGWLLGGRLELELDLEDAAVAHHSVFGMAVHPHAGVFLGDPAQAGAWDDRVRAHFEQAGFAPAPGDVAVDHLGMALAFSSYVCGAIADAHEDGRVDVVDRLERIAEAFLDECVLSWLPVMAGTMVVATAGDGDHGGDGDGDGDGHGDGDGARGFWRRVVEAALELTVEHRLTAGSPLSVPRLRPAPELLDDPDTDLRAITRYLLTPARSGVFLTRADIARAGRRADVPRGFGSRSVELRNLLQGAAELGELSAVLAGLVETVATGDDALAVRGRALGIESVVDVWLDARASTRDVLSRMAEARSPDCTIGSGPLGARG